MKRARDIFAMLAVASFLAGRAYAQSENPEHPVIAWEGVDAAGKPVKVPAADEPTVVAFVRAGQEQSEEILKEVTEAVGKPAAAQVVVVVSGIRAEEQGKAINSGPLKSVWPVVLDPAFTTSGQMGVHVWPTTIVVDKGGRQVAHLAGASYSFAVQLDAYLKFAAGKLDEAGLKQKLQVREVVTDSAEEKAGRHLRLAEKLIEQSRLEAAVAELDVVVKASPKDPSMRLQLARALALVGRAQDALGVLDGLPDQSLPGWQCNVVRARALIGVGKWDAAKAALADSVKLNPDPAEAHYLLGVVYQHAGDAAHAAECFRLAFESSPSARGKTVDGRRSAARRG